MNCENPSAKDFWNSRWYNSQLGWDIGFATPAITSFMETYPNKNVAILIPGCGNAYEADFLLENGFTNITLLDIAPLAIDKLRHKYHETPQVKICCGDFFEHEGQYEVIIEQTFFCAILPSLRAHYVSKAASLLSEHGKIIGLLFNTDFKKQGPPFSGSAETYKVLFAPYFIIEQMETSALSIPQRANREVFIDLTKKSKL